MFGETQDEKGLSGGTRCAEPANPPSHTNIKGTRARNAKRGRARERAVVSMDCCRLTGVVSLGSSWSFHSEGPGGSGSEGNPRETQDEEQAIDVRMAEVQGDRQSQSERVAHQVALQLGPTTDPKHARGR